MPKKVGTRANKAKGRKLQKDVVDFILKFFRTLTKDDVWKVIQMGLGILVIPLAGWVWNTNVLVADIDATNKQKHIMKI